MSSSVSEGIKKGYIQKGRNYQQIQNKFPVKTRVKYDNKTGTVTEVYILQKKTQKIVL